MLKIAGVKPGDVVYDLGSGDGRIVISAVEDFGATLGVGIDLDPARTAEATANAKAAGVADRVTFLTQDLFASDFNAASVVAVYLLPQLLQRLMPKLRALTPGTRIVSHNYDMGAGWPPDRTIFESDSLIHFWRVPWRLSATLSSRQRQRNYSTPIASPSGTSSGRRGNRRRCMGITPAKSAPITPVEAGSSPRRTARHAPSSQKLAACPRPGKVQPTSRKGILIPRSARSSLN